MQNSFISKSYCLQPETHYGDLVEFQELHQLKIGLSCKQNISPLYIVMNGIFNNQNHHIK